MKKIYLILVLIILFILLSIQVFYNNLEIDNIVNLWASWINNSIIFKNIFLVIAWLWDTYWVILITLFLIIYFLHKKYIIEIIILVWVMGWTVMSSTLVKYLVWRIRPDNMIMEYSWYSFPSWHSTMAVLFYGLLFYIIKDKIENRKIKIFIATAFVIFTILIIFSRIYLSVHFFTDVIWWIILWSIWLLIWIILYSKKDKILNIWKKL